jgi:hypothetical protein
MNPMKNWLTPIIIILVLLIPGVATAQENVTFASLEIDLWPEYDRPEMLVIYRIELSPIVSLPVEVSIQIPAVTGEPNAVAVRDLNGSLLNTPYERQVEGDVATITITAAMPGIQIEYYDPQLTKNGRQRNFEVTWMGNYQIDSLFIQLQQPYDASEVVTVPAATTVSPSSDGLTYHSIDLGPRPAGETTSVSIGYVKETEALSIERLEVQPVAPLSDSTSGRVNTMDIFPWVLGGLGIVLVVGGVWLYMHMGKQQPQPSKRNRGKRPSTVKSPSSETGDKAIYCHECGKRAGSGDRFCRSCGVKLRDI